MKGRRDNPAHHTGPAEVRDVPEVGMDYCCFRRADCEDKITVLFQKDRASKAIRSQIVESKGVKCEEAIEAALRGIREFGHHGKIALKADGENAVKALKGEVLRRLDGGGFSIQPPAHEHESNGGVENGVKIFKGLFRVRLLALERNIDAHIPIDHSILCWLVEFVGDLVSKYLIGVDGKTGCERLFGKKVLEEQLEFGELVLWRKPRLQDYGVVAQARWETGVWVGRRWGTPIHFVSFNDRVVECRAVQRVPKADRWKRESTRSEPPGGPILLQPSTWQCQLSCLAQANRSQLLQHDASTLPDMCTSAWTTSGGGVVRLAAAAAL